MSKSQGVIQAIEVRGAQVHNLKSIDVSTPLSIRPQTLVDLGLNCAGKATSTKGTQQ